MGLTLIAGPANAGKVALLLERYLERIGDEPVLIVPNRSDVDRVQHDLLAQAGAVFGGWIGTFADLFERIAKQGGDALPVVGDVQRSLLVRRVLQQASLNGLGRSARFGGFADSLIQIVAELEAGLLAPAELAGELAMLYAGYRAELERLGRSDRQLREQHAVERVANELSAWDGAPVFAYGFEDLTAAQWSLLETLAGRAEVTVTLPYEPGRPVFASLRRTADDLAALARERIEELPPAYAAFAHPALAHLERALFSESPGEQPRPSPPPLEGAVRFLEGAGARGSLELVAEELLALVRARTPPERIALVVPSLERFRSAIETALGGFGVPYALEGRLRLDRTSFGQALLGLLAFEWRDGGRRELFRFLRSPYSGVTRAHADYLEGRLRGRAVVRHDRVDEVVHELRGQPLPPLEALRAAASPLDAVRGLVASMLRAAYTLDAPPVGDHAKLDLRAHDEVVALLDELAGWLDLGGEPGREDVIAALERASVHLARSQETGRVHVLDLMRARGRRYDVVFVLGLEEGSLPRRTESSPFLDDDARRELDLTRRARLQRPDPVARERYLFYTACTRPSRRLYLVREAASDEGSPRQASPFWEEARALFDDEEVRRWTIRTPLSRLTSPIQEAPTERERLRAVAALAAHDPETAAAYARANGWERRLGRACRAFRRETRLTHPLVLEELAAKRVFSVTELETFADCSSMWFVDRVVSPRQIDGQVDARLRGSVAHSALHKFFAGLPKAVGTERVGPENLDDALRFLDDCLDEAIAGGVRIDLSELERSELHLGLRRDLQELLRSESESGLPLVPKYFEVSFGTERSTRAGLDLGGFSISGKIDRVDVDPFSARGIVWDYKSGKTVFSAAKIDSEKRLQIPLYMLVLRDQLGLEPLGGLYRALAGQREARGLLRAEARDDGLPGFFARDYLDEEAFWGQVEKARELAGELVGRIREGDVRHDPKGGSCPSWCTLAPTCRVKRA
ncbi:MAG TPA: PD-(D/E)XK nuclease family protein [Gaiellaceae bacterium]|nr:PD-(D/E)XK nuclease family protein [Gaiellaceae bacterium]